MVRDSPWFAALSASATFAAGSTREDAPWSTRRPSRGWRRSSPPAVRWTRSSGCWSPARAAAGRRGRSSASRSACRSRARVGVISRSIRSSPAVRVARRRSTSTTPRCSPAARSAIIRGTSPRGEIDAGPAGRAPLESVALRDNPLGDPHERPLWVYTPPGYAGGPRRLRAPGLHGAARDVAQPGGVPADLPRAARPRGRRRAHRLRRCLHLRRRLPVRRFERERPLPHLPLRRDRSVRRRPLRLERLPRRRRQVERRPGRRRDRDAPARFFHGVASHAGGGLFEVSIRPFFRVAARRLRDAYGGSIERFLDELHTGPRRSRTRTTCTSCSSGASRRPTRPTRTARSAPARRRHRAGDPRALGALAEWDYPTLVPRHADALRGLRPSTSTSAHATTGTST